jgi:hypothetical protein
MPRVVTSSGARNLGRIRRSTAPLAVTLLLTALISGDAVGAQSKALAKGTVADRPVMIYALGQESCGLWLDAYTHRDNKMDLRLQQFDAYLFGFASAYNMYGPDGPGSTNNILSGDVYAQHAFFERHCHDHPLDVYVNAITTLLGELSGKNLK